MLMAKEEMSYSREEYSHLCYNYWFYHISTDEKSLHLLIPERDSASKLIYSSTLSDQFMNS
jgi:hypothetical protein